ncbi:MAG: nitroreductase family protein [Desulfobacterales bacterium]|nr:nitroreductase family protein [Desulfobacterales bacterium]
MKKIILVALLFFGLFLSHAAGQQDIKLPKVKAKAGMDIIQAMETRAASRGFGATAVPMEAISTILWAGNGIILEKGTKTVHGYDAVTSATNLYRYTTPWGWGDPYIKLYLILKEGTYEYLPQEHELKFISANGRSGGANAFGVIVIAADFDEMPGSNKDVKNVAFLSAGSAAQNMYVAGAVYNIQMLTQVSINKKRIKKQLNLPDKVEPLATLTFGYAN